jgi:hypothetical protein
VLFHSILILIRRFDSIISSQFDSPSTLFVTFAFAIHIHRDEGRSIVVHLHYLPFSSEISSKWPLSHESQWQHVPLCFLVQVHSFEYLRPLELTILSVSHLLSLSLSLSLSLW